LLLSLWLVCGVLLVGSERSDFEGTRIQCSQVWHLEGLFQSDRVGNPSVIVLLL
jgi:hypothetical protein